MANGHIFLPLGISSTSEATKVDEVFVIVFGSCEWLFVCIAMWYADELTLIDARDALLMQT